MLNHSCQKSADDCWWWLVFVGSAACGFLRPKELFQLLEPGFLIRLELAEIDMGWIWDGSSWWSHQQLSVKTTEDDNQSSLWDVKIWWPQVQSTKRPVLRMCLPLLLFALLFCEVLLVSSGENPRLGEIPSDLWVCKDVEQLLTTRWWSHSDGLMIKFIQIPYRCK